MPPLSAKEEQPPHLPVLANEIASLVNPLTLKSFVDTTVGAGGHSKMILEKHPEIQQLYAIDQDSHALEITKRRLAPWGEKVTLLHGNFDQMEQLLMNQVDSTQVDALLMDLGVSSMQIDNKERGFSLRFDGPLDMRMNSDSNTITAYEIVNKWSYEALVELFFRYGEEPQARKAAKLIQSARNKKCIASSLELAKLLEPLGFSSKRRRSLHPATRIFQALRIAVNDELGALERALPQAFKLLKCGGRLIVITFHSLEDRIVKRYFAHLCSDKENSSGLCGLFLSKKKQAIALTRKPLTASAEELAKNSRAQCAKVRAIEKVEYLP